MTEIDWAYARSDRARASTLLDELIATTNADARTDLLLEWGAFVTRLDDVSAAAATAGNVIRDAAGLTVDRPLRSGLDLGHGAPMHAWLSWHLAHALVTRGAASATPDLAVDALAVDLAGRAGMPIAIADIERFVELESTNRAQLDGGDAARYAAELREAGTLTARRATAEGCLASSAMQAALLDAYGQLDEARRDRDRAEAAAIELAAARELARSLGEELERDEWIRARLRRLKATPPARALIAGRKRLARRADGPTKDAYPS